MVSKIPYLQAIIDTAHSISADLFDGIMAKGNFWGNDEVGESFVGIFGPGLHGGHLLLKGCWLGVEKGANDVHGTAQLFKNADDVNTEIATTHNTKR
jgi:hypothetical protein